MPAQARVCPCVYSDYLSTKHKMQGMYAPEEHKERRLCVRAGDGCGHSSYYLLSWFLLSAGFGSVETDSSSPCIRQ